MPKQKGNCPDCKYPLINEQGSIEQNYKIDME